METRITLPFADGDYEFWLPMPRIVAVEREAGKVDRDGVKQPHSIFAIFHDIGSHVAQIGDEVALVGPTPALISEAHAVIRNALIGGDRAIVDGEEVAVGDAMARDLVGTYCYPARPAMHDMALAWKVLHAAIYGVAEGSKKKEAETSGQEDLIKAGSS